MRLRPIWEYAIERSAQNTTAGRHTTRSVVIARPRSQLRNFTRGSSDRIRLERDPLGFESFEIGMGENRRYDARLVSRRLVLQRASERREELIICLERSLQRGVGAMRPPAAFVGDA